MMRFVVVPLTRQQFPKNPHRLRRRRHFYHVVAKTCLNNNNIITQQKNQRVFDVICNHFHRHSTGSLASLPQSVSNGNHGDETPMKPNNKVVHFQQGQTLAEVTVPPAQPTLVRSVSLSSPHRPFFSNRNRPQHRTQQQQLQQQHLQHRSMSTTASMLPEVLQNISIWGGTGILIKTFHMDGLVPYWACFSLINISLRACLFPLVLYSAQTAARFGKVAAEIQFFVSLFQNDYKAAKASGIPGATVAQLRLGYQSLRGIYKLHKINPLAAFFPPLLQIPFFLYFGIDLRKMVNGRDPELAQALTDCNATGDSVLFWIADLTEPDPLYVLPIMAGVAMYANMEVALGQRTLAGPAASQADTGVLLKDIFQSVAVFMPCFASHNPAGMQIYLVTSFLFTSVQSYALRNESFRLAVGLPSLVNKVPEKPKWGMTFLELKKLEQEADAIRGDGPLLGKYVLAHGYRLSFPGMQRPSTIEIDTNAPKISLDNNNNHEKDDSYLDIIQFFRLGEGRGLAGTTTKIMPHPNAAAAANLPFIHGISAPYEEMERRAQEEAAAKLEQEKVAAEDYETMAQGERLTEEQMIKLMEKANRGEKPVLTKFVDASNNKSSTPSSTLNLKRLTKRKGSSSSAGKKKSKRK